MYRYAIISTFILNILLTPSELSTVNQCSNLEPNKVKILGTVNIMKVWFGSEVSVTCCMKDSRRLSNGNEYLEDELDGVSTKESDNLVWYDPNMKPILNYFSDPSLAQSSGIFALPDAVQGPNNIKMIHLVIKNFSMSDNGDYKCDTVPTGHEPSTIRFEGYHKIVIDAEEHQFLEENTLGDITCRPKGHNNIDIVWFYEGKHLSPDNHKFSFLKKHSILRVSKVTEETAGKYLCKAEVSFPDQSENSRQNQFIELQPIEVTVYQHPTLINDSPAIVSNLVNGKIEDHTLNLGCEATGLPPPTITWFKNKTPVNETPDSRIKISESYYQRNVYSSLKIFPIEVEDIGTYTCNASIRYKNFMRSVAKNITPELVFQPHFLAELTNLKGNSLIGGSATLNCTVFGASIDKISLSFEQNDFNNKINIFNDDSNNPRLVFSKYQDKENPYISHYQLKIEDVQPEDAGLYSCITSIKSRNVYTISKNGMFTVSYKPKVTTPKSTTYGLWFKKNVLKCRAKGFPNPEWTWTFHNSIIPKDHNQFKLLVTINNDSSTSELVILPDYLNDAIFGSYQCSAKNYLGSDLADILFMQAWQPGPPKVELCKVTSSSIQLCVSQNNDTGGLPLSHYELRLKESELNRYIGPFYYPVSPSTITLSHLKSNVKYKFALSAVSEAGRGSNSYIEVVTKPLGKPLIELVNTTASPDWNAYNLRWVVDTDGGLPIVKYDVEIQQVRVDLQTRKIVERVGPVKNYVIKDIGQLKHMFRVNSLHPNTYYELKFWAENLMGPSPIQEVVFRTLEQPLSMAGSSMLRDPFGSSTSVYNCNLKHLALPTLLLTLFKRILS